MSAVDDAVRASLDAQKQKYIDSINAQKASAEADIHELQNQLQAQDTRLANDFIGFRIGITAPAYTTNQAGVLERDPLRGLSASVPAGGSIRTAPAWIIFSGIAAAIYFLNKGRK